MPGITSPKQVVITLIPNILPPNTPLPQTTQHPVPAGGLPLPGQDFHLPGRIEGFYHGYPEKVPGLLQLT